MVLLCHLKQEVIDVVRGLILSDDTLMKYMQQFDEEINRGLDKDTCDEALVKSIVTHVNKIPTGEEEGQFLGLDFSGPTIKILLVRLENKECTITRKLYDIPEKYMTAKSEKLFDFIAKCIKDFLGGLKLKMSRLPLGVTFGFPIEQASLQQCRLLRWSKGFKCDDLINKNIFFKLKASIRKLPELKKIFVIGIMNDAVSAVMACGWQETSCMIGAVIGQGASCCYVEKADRVTKYDAESFAVRNIYINLESAQMGEDGSLEEFRTHFDQEMDEQSAEPGKYINDKLISSIYFGELSRLAIIKCLESDIILGGQIPEQLSKKGSLTFEHLRRIESDPDDDHTNCGQVLTEFGFQNVTDEDCFQVQFICRCVSRRSANLVAAQLATLINRINGQKVTIAAGGELIKEYPNYKWYLERKIQQLKNEECKLMELEEDYLGPAVLAAIFGEDSMDRDEKTRRLPGFPMDECHFGKNGKCLDPECSQSSQSQPCVPSAMNPLMTKSEDLGACPCQDKEEKDEQEGEVKCEGKKEKDEKEGEFKCEVKTEKNGQDGEFKCKVKTEKNGQDGESKCKVKTEKKDCRASCRGYSQM